MNFFDLGNFDAVTEFVNDAVTTQYGTYAYVKSFAAIKWEEPDSATEPAEHVDWTRARLGLYGILAECGFPGTQFVRGSSATTLSFGWKKADYDDFEAEYPGLVTPPTTSGSSTYRVSSPKAAREVTLFMADRGTWNTSSSGAGDKPFKDIAGFLERASGKAAVRVRPRLPHDPLRRPGRGAGLGRHGEWAPRNRGPRLRLWRRPDHQREHRHAPVAARKRAVPQQSGAGPLPDRRGGGPPTVRAGREGGRR